MESIVVALIGGAVTLVGVVLSNSRSRAVMEVKIDELSRRARVAQLSGRADVPPRAGHGRGQARRGRAGGEER